MPSITLSQLTGGSGAGVMPVEKAFPVDTAFDNIFSRVVVITGDFTGAGGTVSANGRFVLLGLSMQDLTASDTFYTLTIDGKIRAARATLPLTGSGTVVLYDAFLTRTTAGTSALTSAGIQAPIIVNQSLDLFVRTVTDNSITVNIIYAEIE